MEGVLLTEHLPHIDWDDLYRNLRQSGEPFGLTFGDVTILSNARLSLLASEFARDQGMYDQFHEAVFKAYFTDLQDIGRLNVLLAIAEKTGLNPDALKTALAEQRYLSRLQEVTTRARRLGINSAPTFIINQQYSIVGAQPLEAFRDILQNPEQLTG